MKLSHRLLAFLNCCTSSSVGTEDTSPPPKRSPKRPAPQGRQPAPEKAEVKPGDSNATEPSEPPYVDDEKPKQAVSSDRTESLSEEKKCSSAQEEASASGDNASDMDKFGSDPEKSSQAANTESDVPDHSQNDTANLKSTLLVAGTVQERVSRSE